MHAAAATCMYACRCRCYCPLDPRLCMHALSAMRVCAPCRPRRNYRARGLTCRPSLEGRWQTRCKHQQRKRHQRHQQRCKHQRHRLHHQRQRHRTHQHPRRKLSDLLHSQASAVAFAVLASLLLFRRRRRRRRRRRPPPPPVSLVYSFTNSGHGVSNLGRDTAIQKVGDLASDVVVCLAMDSYLPVVATW